MAHSDWNRAGKVAVEVDHGKFGRGLTWGANWQGVA